MTKEIRSPNVERDAGVRAGFRHSDIPSEFAIRHSDLGTAVHGEPPFLLRTHWDHEPEPAVPLSAGSGSWSQCVRKRKGGSPGTAVPKSECRIANSEGISECRKPALTPASRSTFGLRIS